PRPPSPHPSPYTTLFRSEGRTHVLSACQYITKDAYPDDHPFEVDLPYGSTAIRRGSVIVAPTGEVLAGPVYDEETILYADIDPRSEEHTSELQSRFELVC